MRPKLAELTARYAAESGAHRPLRVSCRLVRSVALNDAVLFDGLLRVAVAKEYLRLPALAGMPLPDDVAVPLPLSTSTASVVSGAPPKRPYPLVSLGYADTGATVVLRPGHPRLLEYTAAWHKTWEHSGDDYLVFCGDGEGGAVGKPKRGKLSLASAQYKGWSMTLNVLAVRSIHFWARGDAEEVARLLTQVPAVGKKQSYGFGLVAPLGWAIEEVGDGEDWSESGPRGPTRPLPTVDRPSQPPWSTLGHGAYRSPAYRSRDWCDVWIPA